MEYVYVQLIKNGLKTIDDVPNKLKEKVKKLLEDEK